MTIAEAREKCKILVTKMPRDVLIITILILASFASFGLGYLAGLDVGSAAELPKGSQGSGVMIEQAPTQEVGAPTGSVGVVASKSGTKYYLPSCAGANRISDANKVWFASVELAKASGYTPAVNCEGL